MTNENEWNDRTKKETWRAGVRGEEMKNGAISLASTLYNALDNKSEDAQKTNSKVTFMKKAQNVDMVLTG